jgi:hypothetical protein
MGLISWVGVWLGVITWVGVWLGVGLAGGSVAAAVSDGSVMSVAWAMGLSVAGGVVSRQADMTRTTAKESNKSELFLFFAVHLLKMY